ncbi:uncharacterized protein JCM6883_004427 [Sporobolomyces salmoneus]|uniref:uncharacterized protein n=1 Tax=Sporobolomyces salmoneus TaxID=183962 RepID=UPI00317A7C44
MFHHSDSDSADGGGYSTSYKLGRSHRGIESSRTLEEMMNPNHARKSHNVNGYVKSSRSRHRSSQRDYSDESEPEEEDQAPSQPRAAYYREVAEPSREVKGPLAPKSRLLVSDLDNTLFGPSGDGIVARPYLKTFIRYIMHPETPYNLAIWTFSGRRWGQAHLRQAGVGELLFEGPDRVVDDPKLKEPLKVLWGYEDSGFLPSPPHRYGSMASGPAVKDLELIWELLNIQGKGDWSPYNSLIVDDQIANGRLEPDSIMVCPLFTNKSPDDDFLLAFIGVLDELAPESNFAAVIKRRNFREGIDLEDLDRYSERGKAVCLKYGIKVSRRTPYHDPAFIEDVKQSPIPVVTPIHDAAPEPSPSELDPGSFSYGRPVPKRVAKGMPLTPSDGYLKMLSKTSRVGRVGKPLLVFDLDGTLYHRPPQNLEHDPTGEPTGRPYLRSVLQWILRPESPWTVAFWTGSQKTTAVRCLYELDLGIIGPKLINNEAEILHPKIKALWAREDFNLTPEDYRSYVAVVKDLSRLWKYLSPFGTFDATNCVIVDDTPSKLRAQPDNLIAAPTFDYPEEPSEATTRYQLDTFLLSLVAMLGEIAVETNFANFIESQGWNKVLGERELREFAKEGVMALKNAKIAVDAEARGILPGVMSSRNDPGFRTKKQYAIADSLSTSLASSRPSQDALSRVANRANPYHSDSSSDTSSSNDGGTDEAEERSRSAATLSLGRRRRH